MKWAAALAATGIVLLAAATPLRVVDSNTALGKFSRSGELVRDLTGARNEAWSASIDLLSYAPVEGLGFGSGDRLFGLTGTTFTYYQGANSGNAYLSTLLEVGVVGLALLVALLLSALQAAVMPGRTPAQLILRRMAFGLLALTAVESFMTSPGSPFSALMWIGLGQAGAKSGGLDKHLSQNGATVPAEAPPS